MPNDSLAVEGAARTFTCVVVVPSIGDVFDASTLGMGADRVGICIASGSCGLGMGGNVAVTKSGVAVDALIIFPLQPVQSVIAKIKRKIFL